MSGSRGSSIGLYDLKESLVSLPGAEPGPLRKISARVILAVALIFLVAAVTYIGRDGYIDPEDGEISVLDAFYYSTVSITTTGYGDVRPVSDESRLATTLLVTPARVLFLILLVGTTLEILAERTRAAYRISRWRRTLKDHTIICGFGTKGRAAAAILTAQGADPRSIIAIDPRPDARAQATAAGYAAVAGDATQRHVLHEARIEEARAVVVAVSRDDAAVLTTLTARELGPEADIVAACREDENVHLLDQSGADSVISTSSAAGRLLGMATHTPGIANVISDMLEIGQGVDIRQYDVGPEGVTAEVREEWGPIVALQREGELISFEDERCKNPQPGDRVVALHSHT
jgi:voltage-gated potassium channel